MLVGVVFFLAVDALWLGVLMGDWYQSSLAHLLAKDPFLPPAVVFYLAYPILLYILAVSRGASSGSVFLRGAMLGLLAYGTYDLTNMATLPEWPLAVVLVDILWGMCISGTTALVAWYAMAR